MAMINLNNNTSIKNNHNHFDRNKTCLCVITEIYINKRTIHKAGTVLKYMEKIYYYSNYYSFTEDDINHLQTLIDCEIARIKIYNNAQVKEKATKKPLKDDYESKK